jgi:hypothetical protein
MKLSNLKKIGLEALASRKFEGANIDLGVVDSRLQVEVRLKGSVDLPGDLDQVVAHVGGLLGLGNSPESSEDSKPSAP